MYRLPQECLERLSCSLENGPSVDWNVLATEGFGSIYSDDLKLAKIKSSPRPAWGLIWDLCSRDIRVETLLQALKSIGNERAISIILEGELFTYCCFFIFVSFTLSLKSTRKIIRRNPLKNGTIRVGYYLIFSPRHRNACYSCAPLKATSNFIL